MAISHPKKIPTVMFSQNFIHDLNAGQLRAFPWSTTSEGSLSPGMSASLVCPCDMTFRNLAFRTENMTVTGDVTISIGTLVEGTNNPASIVTLDSHQFEISTSNDYHTFNLDKNDLDAKALKGELLFIWIDPDQDMGSSKDWFITSVWEIPKYKE